MKRRYVLGINWQSEEVHSVLIRLAESKNTDIYEKLKIFTELTGKTTTHGTLKNRMSMVSIRSTYYCSMKPF